MQMHGFMTNVIAGAALALVFSFTARASSSRTFVSTTGSDANAGDNCSVTANCRTLAVALSVTNANGEVVVLNSAGIGAATITQGVVITAIGVDASIFVTSGDALTINTSGNVTITGLDLDGGGSAMVGIQVSNVGVLRLYNMKIQNFAFYGISFNVSTGFLAVNDSKINDCVDDGLAQFSGKSYVRNTEFNNMSGAGAASFGGAMTIADSSAHDSYYGFYADGGTLSLYNDRAVFNQDGLYAVDGGIVYFADCFISDNADAYYIGPGGTIASSSPGSSLITPGQSTFGTLGTATTLQ
jgi:hypothetical protein